jgi:hypothetical protein
MISSSDVWRGRWRALIYPELRDIPEPHWNDLVTRSKREPHDLVEWIGIALGLAVVTAMTSYATDGLAPLARALRAGVNLVAAFPLLLIVVGPFEVRRVRRALRTELQRRRRS